MSDLDLPALRRIAEGSNDRSLISAATEYIEAFQPPTVLALVTSAERLAEAERLLRIGTRLVEHPSKWKDDVNAFLANASPAQSQDVVGEIVAELKRQSDEAWQQRPHVMVKEHAFLSGIAEQIERRDWRKEKPDEA